MLSKLPQASPLLAAIGEEMSFTKAAERLNIDQSAVSHRVKALEEALGHSLFDRTTRKLRLTEIGEILCHGAIDTLKRWDIALDKLERSRSTNLIQLSLPSSLAMKWLIPALPNAQAQQLNIAIGASDEAVDLLVHEADAAIRFGPGPYPGLHTTRLSDCWLQPVASPLYLANKATDISLLTDSKTILLADRRGEIDKTDFSWQYYFDNTESAQQEITDKHQFDRADLMLQGAIAGMGLGLGRTLLIEGDINRGLIKAIGEPIPMRSAYWLVCSASFAETERFKRLRDWLKTEVQNTARGNETQQEL